jgi:hypothetical protein
MSVHTEKVKLSAASGGLLEHDYRFYGDGFEKHEHVKDPSLTRGNLIMLEVESGEVKRYSAKSQNAAVSKARVRRTLTDATAKHRETAGRKPKSNAVGLVSTVVTLPYDWPSDRDPAEFFKAAYQALEEYYEVKGVDSAALPAAVHMDETTPHMHHLKVPVHEGRIDANSVLNRAFYQGLHPHVQQRVTELTGVECHVLLDEDDAERRALSHVPQDELDAAVRALTKQADAEAQRMRSEAARAVSRAARREKALDAREAALDAREAALDERARNIGLLEQMSRNDGKTMAVDHGGYGFV